MHSVEVIRNFYGRFERPISSFSLIFGFIFDALTLKRVDTLWENVWILGHLIIIAIFILLVHLHDTEPGSEKNPQRAHFWYVNILQFFFGGILSTYLVFYFRSTDIFTTWPFLLILTIAFVANESMKQHYIRLSFQISLFFLSIYAFAIFFVPVIFHKIGTKTFLLSGTISLVLIVFFIIVLFYFTKEKFSESKRLIIPLVLGIFALMNLLYFTNLIPPIPLSLKDGEIYHSIQKNDEKNYIVAYQKKKWIDYFKLFPDFKKNPEAPIYAFSAIFSPKYLNTTIIHEWQYYNLNNKKWKKEIEIPLPVIGGREEGFRTYSKRSDLKEGKWRVIVKTEEGQIIGQIRFNLITTNEQIPVSFTIK